MEYVYCMLCEGGMICVEGGTMQCCVVLRSLRLAAGWQDIIRVVLVHGETAKYRPRWHWEELDGMLTSRRVDGLNG